MTRRPRTGGFSLLEVMIALAILAMSLAILMRMSSTDIRSAHKAKLLSIATGLARAKMYDIEEIVLHDGFSDTPQCDKQPFRDEGHPEFEYEYCVEPVKLPEAQDIAAEKSAANSQDQKAAGAGAKDAKDSTSAALGGGGAGGGMVGMYFPMIKPVLENSIRKVSLQVRWSIGNQPQKLDVVCFLTDIKAIDQAAKTLPAGGSTTSTPAPTPKPSPTGSPTSSGVKP